MKQLFRQFVSLLLAILLTAPAFPARATDQWLEDEARTLLAIAAEDPGAAIRYYHENMIYNGIYGTYILGETADDELALLSGKTLLSIEKRAGDRAEDQQFRLYVYTDRGKRYMIPLSTAVRSVYSCEELLREVPEDEAILFAVFHYNGYEYEDGAVGFRFTEIARPLTAVGGKEYFVKSDGSLAVGGSRIVDGVRYRFGEDGALQGRYTGFTRSDKGRRYWKDGVLVKNRWIRVGGERKYYAGADGYFVTGTHSLAA